jgi:hypothetical protein
MSQCLGNYNVLMWQWSGRASKGPLSIVGIRFYMILDFTVFEWTFLFIVVYLQSICKCILMGRNNVT